MKKTISVLAICILCIISCTIEPSNNGDLDGYWCLTEIDSLQNGNSVDYHSARVFWAFQGSIMQTQYFEAEGGDKYTRLGYYFSKEGDRLTVSNPYLSSDRTTNDRAITDDSLFVLRPLGINSREESFTIEKLTGSNMILRNDILRLHFEKY